MSNQWISTKKAAELLGVSQRTVQNWVDDGRLPSTRTAGGHRRLDPEDLRTFLKSRYSPSSNPGFLQPNQLSTPVKDGVLQVLVVEDDYNILRLCELQFTQFSVPNHLHMASNAFQGLIMIGKYQPHIVFTDLKMPQIDGLQMIREILKIPEMQKTKIVVVTGMETQEIMKMGPIPEGIILLPKPIPFNTVETILYQHANALCLIPEED
jgi:excisionase family DNA binding protein